MLVFVLSLAKNKAVIKLLSKFAFRNLIHQKLYTLINVVGLMLGLLTFFAVIFYVDREKNFDRFNTKYDRIYRLTSATKEREAAIVPYAWAQPMKNEISAIEDAVSFQNITIALTVKKGSEVYAQHGFLGVDSTFLKIFDYPLLQGNRRDVLRRPDKMLITPEMATKYFGANDPIGQSLEVNLWGTDVTFEVEGIIVCPPNAHLQFKFLIPIEPVKMNFFSQNAFGSWTTHFAHTYFLMNESFDQTQVEQEMKAFLLRHGGDQLANKYTPAVQPLKDIYLKSDEIKFDFLPRGDSRQLMILLVVAFGILIMAVINFTNISSAQSLGRLKETSLRKILGSRKADLFLQFVMESILTSLIATLLAILLLFLLNSPFERFTGIAMISAEQWTIGNLLLTLCIGLGVGIISGLYPASLISSFKPVSVLRSRSGNELKSGVARRVLVVIQFSLAVMLLSAAGIVYKQVRYMLAKDLGFNKEQIVILESARPVASNPAKMDLLRNILLEYKDIHAVTASSSFPGDHEGQWAARFTPEGMAADESTSIWTIYADHDFVNTYELELVQGRDFNRDIQSDSTAAIINQAAVQLFANSEPSWMHSPLNKYLEYSGGQRAKVIGVLKDFHFQSLKQDVNPLVLQIEPENAFSIQLRLQGDTAAESLQRIESSWKELFPDIPFGYSFLDQRFAVHFESDKRLGKVLQLFTTISIVLAALGLFGLATFLVYHKSREMSIRKLMGASEGQLTRMLCWNFLKLILIANVIAIPASYILMYYWLEGFSFKENPSVWVFLLAATLSILIALVTIAKQAYKTATVNPVEMLSAQ